MSFTPDMASASHRHLQAADALDGRNGRAVAGYLYGLAAECAVKAIMLEAGIRQLPQEAKSDDPYYAHFPHLRVILRESLEGRSATILRRFIENDNFFSYWDIKIRYCKRDQVLDRWIDTWRDQARQVVSAIGT